MIDDNHDYDEGPACCKSCGVPYSKHLGLQGTCEMLREAMAVIDSLLATQMYLSEDCEIDAAERARAAAKRFVKKMKGRAK